MDLVCLFVVQRMIKQSPLPTLPGSVKGVCRLDIYDVIRAMDMSVFCSDHEGLPMALLETLYLEIPVVARPVGGIAEVIQDGVSGVWVRSAEPEDLAAACISLLRDDTRRDSLAREGAAVVAREFTARHTAQRTTTLYRSLSGIR